MGGKTSRHVGCVVAIDFGTSNSGYAYCLGQGEEIYFDSDPTWKDGRISTDLLMDSKVEEALEFGPRAGESYRKSLERKDKRASGRSTRSNTDYFLKQHKDDTSGVQGSDEVPVYNDPVLLEKIKLQVLALTDPTDFRLRTVSGEKIYATKAFAAALSYMKKRCLDDIHRRRTFIDPREILWIVTVPAAWGNQQRNFMTFAADQSGLKASATAQNFTILTESETSVAFCRQLKPSKFRVRDDAEGHTTHHSYMILDAGGGTVDISIVRKSQDGQIETTKHNTSGGRWGGQTVNEHFEQFLKSQSKTVRKFVDFIDQARLHWQRFQDDYEMIKVRSKKDISLAVSTELAECYEQITGESFFDHFGDNLVLECDQENNTLLFKVKYLHRKRFYYLFQELRKLFKDNGYDELWQDFWEEYKSIEEAYLRADRDRSYAVSVRVPREFRDKYEEIEDVSFADRFPRDGLEFDKKRGCIVIPSDEMRWCCYDDFINLRHAKFDRHLKLRAEIWRKFMESFEEAKHCFIGTENLVMDLKQFPFEFENATGKRFLKDNKHIGINRFQDDNGNEMLEISASTVNRRCFQPVLDEMKEVLNHFHAKDSSVRLLYIVRGFANCSYLQSYIHEHFARENAIKVLVPEKPASSVLEGTIHFAYSRLSTDKYRSECTIFVRSATSTDPEVIISKDTLINISAINRVQTKPYPKGKETVIELIATTDTLPGNKARQKAICEFSGLNKKSLYYVTVAFDVSCIRVYLDEENTGNSIEKCLDKKCIPKDSCCVQ